MGLYFGPHDPLISSRVKEILQEWGLLPQGQQKVWNLSFCCDSLRSDPLEGPGSPFERHYSIASFTINGIQYGKNKTGFYLFIFILYWG